MCLGVKHTLINGKKVQRMKLDDSQVHSHFGSCTHAELRMFKALVGKVKEH
jgi:hypothetical protein